MNQPLNQVLGREASSNFRRDSDLPFNSLAASNSSVNSLSLLSFSTHLNNTQALFNWQASKGTVKERLSAIFNREV